MSAEVACAGCGAMVPDVEAGAEHRYIGAAPGCWELYTQLLAREYQDWSWARLHQLTVDAYAVQHPGVPGRQAQQSVATHLVGLCLAFERGQPMDALPALRQRFVETQAPFPWLEPPSHPGDVTVVDVLQATTREEHLELVDRWARSVWSAWDAHHTTVRRWVDLLCLPASR